MTFRVDDRTDNSTAVSELEANERGSKLIGRRTYFTSKCKGLWSKAKGIVVMREWRNVILCKQVALYTED